MPRYKRTADEAQLDIPLQPEIAPEHVETIEKLRNMWEFASLMQYIQIFGDTLKIDRNVDIERLEAECLKSEPSPKLAEIGLQLLKYVSSHRGLTPEIFDEYARRQYVAKAPQRNPFGEDEDPIKFNDLDIFTRIRVLQQLSTWTLGNADRIRGMLPDADHTDWRMEPLGWDKEDRAYFVLDDNRLYRRTDEPSPPPSPKPKAKAKSKATPKKQKSRGTRASKRRKVEETSEDEVDETEVKDVKEENDVDGDTKMTNGESKVVEHVPGFGFTDKTWECIAVTRDDYEEFQATIFRSRDPNEKQLHKRILENVFPTLDARKEELLQQKAKEAREREIQERMYSAKRSGRLAEKHEKERQDREQREAEEKRKEDLRMAHAEEERIKREAEGYESRRQTREQRVRERETKRILHEEELAKLEEQESRAASQDPTSAAYDADAAKRMSQRQAKAEKERHKQELEKLQADEGDWEFDCVGCGKRGVNFDDGTHSVACERCNVWQHSKCHNISPEQAEDPDFHFICGSCKQKEEVAKKPKIAPLKLSKSRSSKSPEDKKKSVRRPSSSSATNGSPRPNLPEHITRQLDGVYVPPYQQQQQQPPGPFQPRYGQVYGPPGQGYPPVGNFAPRPQHFSPPQQPWQGSPFPPPQRPPSSGYAGSPPPVANGYGSPQQHQQQHQAMHQNAVAASGAHPGYQSQQPTYAQSHANGYSPRAPTGAYPITQPPHHFQYQQVPTNHHNIQPSPRQQPPPMPRPGSQGQLMNGFQSPVKSTAQPANGSPPQHQRHPSHGNQPYHPPLAPSPQPLAQQPQNALQRSPSANFPPNPLQGRPMQSPVKSISPQQPAIQPSPMQQAFQQPTTTAQTPAAQRPPSANGAIPHHHQTPVAAQPPPNTTQSNPSPAGSNANAVAADGMSGPWPQSSKAIPQKHDRSPAPAATPNTSFQGGAQALQSSPGALPSSQTIVNGIKAAVPPVALSPSQQMQDQAVASGPASVPVKRAPVENGPISTIEGAQQVPQIQTASQASTNNGQ